MKKVTITMTALAFAFGLTSLASVQARGLDVDIDDSFNASKTVTKNVTKNDNDTTTITKNDNDTTTITKNDNDTTTTKTDLNWSLSKVFNTSKIVNETKLHGQVSGASVYDIGNVGGKAYDGGKGGHGGDAKANGGFVKDDGSANGGTATGGSGGAGGNVNGGDAGTFNASNSMSGLNGTGVTVAIQNTGIAALQQVGVTTMANVTVH